MSNFNIPTPSFLQKVKLASNQNGSLIRAAFTAASALAKAASTKKARASQTLAASKVSASKAQSFTTKAQASSDILSAATKAKSIELKAAALLKGGIPEINGIPATAILESSFPGFPGQHLSMGNSTGASITTALLPIEAALAALGAAVAAAHLPRAQATANTALSTANSALTAANKPTTSAPPPGTTPPTGSTGSSTPQNTLPLKTITVSPADASVIFSQSVKLTAETKDTSGTVVKSTLAWASLNREVASVDQNGSVFGLFPGSAIIAVNADYNGSKVGTIATITVQPDNTLPFVPVTQSTEPPLTPPPGTGGGANGGGTGSLAT